MKITNLHIEQLNKIAQNYGYEISGKEPFSIYCSLDLDKLSENKDAFFEANVSPVCDCDCNILRFGISFAGYGILDTPIEKEYFDSLVNANSLCTELNQYIAKHDC